MTKSCGWHERRVSIGNGNVSHLLLLVSHGCDWWRHTHRADYFCPWPVILEFEMTIQPRRSFTRLLAVGTIFGSLLTPVMALEKVSILLDYAYPEGIHASLHLATEKGWYKEAGLDVEIRDGKGSIVTVQQIAAGQADIGLSQLPSMASAISNGLPVVSIMAFSRTGDNGLVVARDSGINKLSDFKGKKLVSIAGGAVGPFIEPFMKAGGLSKS